MYLVGRGGLEPPTSRLSGVRSNHLSYRPACRRVPRQKCPVDVFEADAKGASPSVAPVAIIMKGYEDGLAAF